MIQVNAMGDACPIPLVKTRKAIAELGGPGVVETLVDNEIAVQNLTKMAQQKGYGLKAEKLGDHAFRVTLQVEAAEKSTDGTEGVKTAESAAAESQAAAAPEGTTSKNQAEAPEACLAPAGGSTSGTVVVISSRRMGEGSPELGETLMKSFLFALTQLETLPQTILFYNGGAFLTIEGSASLEDLKTLEAQGVEILTCGTCLNFYGLADQLAVGGVTNMYSIVETLANAGKVIKP